MEALKFVGVICPLYFIIYVNAGPKTNFCKNVLANLDKLESLSQGISRNVLYLGRCIEKLKSVVFGHSKSPNSEPKLTYMCFLWSGTESDSCGETDVCTAVKTLETKLENLFALVVKISKSLEPPPGKLRVANVLYRFSFPFCNEWLTRAKEIFDKQLHVHSWNVFHALFSTCMYVVPRIAARSHRSISGHACAQRFLKMAKLCPVQQSSRSDYDSLKILICFKPLQGHANTKYKQKVCMILKCRIFVHQFARK